jgi:hypothetical protein
MVKKKTKQIARKQQIIFGTLIVAIGLMAAAVVGAYAQTAYVNAQNEARKQRIMDIYDSLALGEYYIPQFYDVFGDKRVYEYDSSRTQSSMISYTHGDTVSNTVKELKQKAAAAGFVLFDEPYEGGQQHFKSDNNEYLRITVDSKLRADAFHNASIMGQSIDAALKIDPNSGPVNVTIKVNLDDNNE